MLQVIELPGRYVDLMKFYQKLILAIGSVEDMYKDLSKIKNLYPKMYALLADSYESAMDGKFLATLNTSVNVDTSLACYRLSAIDVDNAVRIFNKFGFRSLIKVLQDF